MSVHHRHHVPLNLVVTVALWTAATLTVLACAVLFAGEHRDAAVVMGFASGVLAPAAVAASVRGWLAEIAEAVRTAGNISRANSRPHRVD